MRLLNSLTLVMACVVGTLAIGAHAQDDSGGRVTARVVGGRLVVACDLQSSARRIPANLLVEYDEPHGLLLHNQAAGALRIESQDGSTRPFLIRFPDFSINVERRGLADEDDLAQFTKYHSAEMGENALLGSIGAGILQDWNLTFDLAAGMIEFTRPDAAASVPAASPGTIETDLTLVNGLVWLPVRYDDGAPAALAIGTSRYDSVIDRAVCDERGYDGAIGALRVGALDLAETIALRPEDVIQVHPDGVAGVAGINLLERFRVSVDHVNRRARITPTQALPYPAADRAYFAAMIDEDASAVEAWIEEHPAERLAREACELLVDLRLTEEADEELVQRALEHLSAAMPADLRATRMHDLMLELSDEGFIEYAVAAGAVGVESGRDDRYPETVYRIHGLMGEHLLDAGEDREAWRHLLSAAFGLPEDGPINLGLGRYYEKAGRSRRAFSRYLQAVIKPESAPRAIEGLGRTQGALDEPFSVDVVERMIAGKVRNFGAAGRFERTEEYDSGRTVLVEFFTNANFGDGRGGAIGGALGNQGLLTHFEPTEAVFLSYHTPGPALDPLVNPISMAAAARYGVNRPAVHVMDGRFSAPGAARWHEAEQLYGRARGIVLDALERKASHLIGLRATLESGVVRGSISVTGPAVAGATVDVVVAERAVVCPGKSEIVIHRMVARGSALGDVEGIPFTPRFGRFSRTFATELAALEHDAVSFLDELERSGDGTTARMALTIDPAQVVLVAIVRDGAGRVLQAAQCVPELIDVRDDG